MLNSNDKRLVSQMADAIQAAKRRGQKHFDVQIPAGLACSDIEFEVELLEELSHRGTLRPVGRRAQA